MTQKVYRNCYCPESEEGWMSRSNEADVECDKENFLRSQ